MLKVKLSQFSGKDTAIHLNVIRIGPEVNIIQSNIIENNPELFKLRNYQLKILIDITVDPIVQLLCRVPFSLRDKLENKLDNLEKQDFIEKVNTQSKWVSPGFDTQF